LGGTSKKILANVAQPVSALNRPHILTIQEIGVAGAGKDLGVRAALTGRLMQRGDHFTISTG
jgi:hypothetical protein